MEYKYKPKTKTELIKIIEKEIYEIQGTPDNPKWTANLNCIDTSLITDMSYLFSEKYGLNKFNGDISNWNVSNVTNMEGMFEKSEFNKDISIWNVSNVTNMKDMFNESVFNQPIGKWNVSNVENMNNMFAYSDFNKSIGNWNVSNVKDAARLFYYSKFNQDISNWNLKNIKDVSFMFLGLIFNKDIGNWPEEIKQKTGLDNISVSSKYSKLPDEIKYPETVANIFNYVINNPESQRITKNQAINILTEWLNNKQKEYIRKKINKKTVKQLLTNDFLNIYKNITEKDKFLNLLKENKINFNFKEKIRTK